MSTPASEGYFMPGEWAEHSRTWMAWPCREDVWEPGGEEALEHARAAYADVARAIAGFEPVTMVCNPGDVADASLACGPGVEIITLPIDDSWLRDSGPSFLVHQNGSLAGVDWRFNAWGGKYAPYDNDAAVAEKILAKAGATRFEASLVLEGGSFHVDGEGTLLATEECLLNPNRNPDMSREQVEQALRDFLGVSQIVWLVGGLEDDETDGHIDNVASFARPGAVLALSSDDQSDGNYAVLQENLARLRAATDAKGRKLEVIEVPQPSRRAHPAGHRMALSYINFAFVNGGIVLPAFEAPEDTRVFRLFRDTFPDRKVVQVLAADIVVGGGGIHCITQQQPAPL